MDVSSPLVPQPGENDLGIGREFERSTDQPPIDKPPTDESLVDGPGLREETGWPSRNVVEWAVVLIGALLLALLLRFVVVEAFWIESESMESTLLVGERVLVDKVGYRFSDIEQGDIVVFRRTDAEIAADPGEPQDVIKRVMALGGQTVESRDGTVYVDGQALDESYLDPGTVTDDFGPELVPDGELFVMGDNRRYSVDSRSDLGTIDVDRVVGRAFFLFWPLGAMGSP